MENRITIRLLISGRVQGVFYRMETRRAARRIGVTGWVRNLRDGRVEAVVEGTESKVAEMIAWCRKGPAMAHVADVSVSDETGADHPFEGFSIL